MGTGCLHLDPQYPGLSFRLLVTLHRIRGKGWMEDGEWSEQNMTQKNFNISFYKLFVRRPLSINLAWLLKGQDRKQSENIASMKQRVQNTCPDSHMVRQKSIRHSIRDHKAENATVICVWESKKNKNSHALKVGAMVYSQITVNHNNII